MSLDSRLKEHLKATGDRIPGGAPDIDSVVSRGRRIRMTRFVASGAMAAVVVIGTAVLLQNTPAEEAVTTDPPTVTTAPSSITTTPSDDEQATAGSFATPLGQIEWRQLTGTPDSVPAPDGGLVRTPTGFAAVENVWDRPAWDGAQRVVDVIYWQSADGYQWEPSSLPVPVEVGMVRLEAVGDAYWLITSGPETLWRSDDAQTWVEVAIPGDASGVQLYDVGDTTWLISANTPGAYRLEGDSWVDIDTSAMAPPNVDGVNWSIVPATPVQHLSNTIIPWHFRGSVDWNQIFDVDPASFLYGEWDPSTETIAVFEWQPLSIGERTPLATLRAEQSGDRIRLTDESGAAVHEIVVNDPRIDPASIPEALGRFFGIEVSTLAVVDETDVVTLVPAPWSGYVEPPHSPPIIFAGDQLLAVFDSIGQSEIRGSAWTSTDGVVWEELPRPEFADRPSLNYRVTAQGILVEVESELGEVELWVTTDGATWTFTGVSGTDSSNFVPLGPGGVFRQGGQITAGSADLSDWEAVDSGGLAIIDMSSAPMENGGQFFSDLAAASSVFLILDQGGVRDLWVLTAPD